MVEGLDMTLEQLIQKSKDVRKQQEYGYSGGSGSGIITRGAGSGNGTGTGGHNSNNFHGHENRAPRTRRFSFDRRNAYNTEPYYMLPPPPPPPPPPPEHQLKKSAAQRKLHVSNLNFEVIANNIKVLFSNVGPLEYCTLHYDQSGRSKGTADVVFQKDLGAVQAYKKHNNKNLDGRKLKIDFGVEINSSTHGLHALKDVGGTSGLNRSYASSAPNDPWDKYWGTYAMHTAPSNDLGIGEWARFKHEPFPRGDLLATYRSGAHPLTDDFKGSQMRGSEIKDFNMMTGIREHYLNSRKDLTTETSHLNS